MSHLDIQKPTSKEEDEDELQQERSSWVLPLDEEIPVRSFPLGAVTMPTIRQILKESLCNPNPNFKTVPTIGEELPLASSLRKQQVNMNTSVLTADGLSKETSERLHRLLLVYSVGFHRMLRAVKESSNIPEDTAASVWRMFGFLMKQCKPHGCNYEMQIAILENESMKKIRAMVQEQERCVETLVARDNELRRLVAEKTTRIQQIQIDHQFDEVTRLFT